MKRVSRYRWFVVVVFYVFMLLHQSDRLLISPLTTRIMETFGINEMQMGAVTTGALLVAAFMYPVWGYLYDRYARPKLLALAAFIWGATTWLSAIAPTFPSFIATRATTGIDDSSYPGLYSLIADYFGPSMRGKIYGLLQLSAPIGYLLAMVVAMVLGGMMGWRAVFYITGSLGLVVAVLIFFGVREAPRGRAEPELAELERVGVYRFDRKIALGLFRKPTLLLLFAQGFFGVFPWNVIAFWFFRYLETERYYSSGEVLMTMAPAVIVLAGGYFLGGLIGDFAFSRTPRGRMLVSMGGVLMGAILLWATLSVPLENKGLFMGLLLGTAVFMPFAASNVISTVYDITVPEVRSTALAVQYFMESWGAALAPWLAGTIKVRLDTTMQNAMLWICVTTWVIGSIILAFVAYKVPGDIKILRAQMRERADQELAKQAASTSG